MTEITKFSNKNNALIKNFWNCIDQKPVSVKSALSATPCLILMLLITVETKKIYNQFSETWTRPEKLLLF